MIGEIPASLGQLTGLTELSLSENQLTGKALWSNLLASMFVPVLQGSRLSSVRTALFGCDLDCNHCTLTGWAIL